MFRHQDQTAPPPGWRDNKNQPTVWAYYSHRGQHYDKDLVEDANNIVEVLLIFAGLFAIVVTAFISHTFPMLRPDPNDILISIHQELRHPGTNSAPYEHYIPPTYVVRVNCFLFAGLFLCMLVAIFGLLVKQWTRSYERGFSNISSPHLRARIRHFRYKGAKKWRLAGIVGFLSLLMHLAIFVSAVGIIDLLVWTSPTVGYVACTVFIIGVAVYLATNLLPLFILNAPFHSPVSQFLAGAKQWVRYPIEAGSKYLRSRHQGEEGRLESNQEILEDHFGPSQGKESDENSIARSQIHLDLDIICHLLKTADNSTERWLLDLCFEKIPELTILGQQDASAFHSRQIIMEVYKFLAKGCIMVNKRGEDEVNPDRIPRARLLCNFMTWYLKLPRTIEQNERLKQTLYYGYDPTLLARLLAESDHAPSIITATTTLGHIDHLNDPRSSDGCPVCHRETVTVAIAWTEDDAGPRDQDKVQKVTSLLIKRTECILFADSIGNTSQSAARSECQPSLAALEKGFQRSNPTERDKRLWLNFIVDKEQVASESLKEIWFSPLRTTLNELQIKRAMSPFRPADNASSLTTLQPPRLNYPSPAAQGRGAGFPFHRQQTTSGSTPSGPPATSPSPSFLRPTFSPPPNHDSQ